MEYRKFGESFVLKIDKGEEIVETIKSLAKRENISLASVSGIGAVNHAIVGLFDTRQKKYFTNIFNRDLEIVSLSGNITIKDFEPYIHLHIGLADINGNMYGGHLNEAVISGAGEIIIIEINGAAGREFNEDIGLNLLKFQ